jgi:hypothetical protein
MPLSGKGARGSGLWQAQVPSGREVRGKKIIPAYGLMATAGRSQMLGCACGGLMDERDFFDERQETRKATMTCPHCQQAAEYELGWFIRTKKKQLSGRADERDRAKFAKARSYMVRRDDLVACKNLRCRKRFEVSGVQSVAFLD